MDKKLKLTPTHNIWGLWCHKMWRYGPVLMISMLAVLALGACSSISGIDKVLSPYRIDINQGNFVTSQMLARLKPGMNKKQARFVLGTPLVTDVFHAERWDYVYRFQPGYGEIQMRRISVFFEDELFVRVEGDIEASENAVSTNVEPSPLRVIEVPASSDK